MFLLVVWLAKQQGRRQMLFSVLFLDLVDPAVLFVDTGSKVDGILAEGHVQILQEAVESLRQIRGGTGGGFNTRLSLVDNCKAGMEMKQTKVFD